MDTDEDLYLERSRAELLRRTLGCDGDNAGSFTAETPRTRRLLVRCVRDGPACRAWVNDVARVVALDLYRLLREMENMGGADFGMVSRTQDVAQDALRRSLRALRSLHPCEAARTYLGHRRKQKTLAVVLAKLVGAYDAYDLFPLAVVRSEIMHVPPTAAEEFALLKTHRFFSR